MKKLKHNIIFIAFLIALLLTFTFSLSGCTPESEKASAQIFALDTVIDITAYGENAEDAVSAAKDEVYRLEKLLSVTDAGSDIYRINTSQGEAVKINNETLELIEKSLLMSDATEGNFDITMYNVIKLWGFTTGEYKVPDESEIADALANIGNDKITLQDGNCITVSQGTELDLGGIAKGYIADKAAEVMISAEADYGLISLGGNIRTVGEKPTGELWKVGIRHPEDSGYFITLSTEEGSVITSGAYQRNFTQDGVTYHHIIDPDSGKPSASDAVSVTIIGSDGAMCDALSTAVFVGGTEYADRLYQQNGNFEYVILSDDNCVYASKGLEGRLELADDYKDLQIIYR
ncbi:MAG: FAD:protein FMN transferase [Ruminococcus sp.]|nr:FAD:protein FMN transferase [Ruminococcus sp.]